MTAQPGSPGDSRLHQIDALRGIAAALVAFVFHQYYLTGIYRSGPLMGLPGFTWLHKHGYTMVDLFFVISGYIFCHVYLRGRAMTARAGDFAVARLARLYPLHLLTLIAAAVILHLGDPVGMGYLATDPWHFVLNLLLLQESGLNDGHNFNLPAWSISVEIYCYILFYALAKRFPARLPAISAVIVIAALAVTLGDSASGDRIARGLCGFFAGVLAWHFRDARKWMLIALVIVPLLLFRQIEGVSKAAVLGATTFPALVLLARHIPLLAAQSLQWLGSRSYSIYLIHAPVFWVLNLIAFDGHKLSKPVAGVAILIAIPCVLALSDLSYRCFEEPLRKWLRARWQARGKSARGRADQRPVCGT